MKYKIVLNKTDEGYSVSCPGLPGCWSQGKTEAQAIDNIKDAIQEYLAAVYASVKDSNVREVEIAFNHAENSREELGTWRNWGRASDYKFLA